MNQSDRNRLTILKTLLTLVFCMLAISAGADRDSSRETHNLSSFTSSQSVINELAIPVPVNYSQTPIYEIEIPYFKSLSGIRKSLIDSYLVRNQIFVLRKLLETTVPQYKLFSYLSRLRIHQDDPPDLSHIL